MCCTDELSGNQRAFKLKHFFVVSFLQKQEVKIILWNALISPIFFSQRVLVLREARRVQLSSRALLLLCFGVQRVWGAGGWCLALRRRRGSVVSHGAGERPAGQRVSASRAPCSIPKALGTAGLGLVAPRCLLGGNGPGWAWCECRMPRQTVGTGFGASMTVETVTQTNCCASSNHFKHFAPL